MNDPVSSEAFDASDDEYLDDQSPAEDGSSAGADDPSGEAGTATGDPVTVEGLIDDLVRVTAERDSYLDDSRRLAADFANFRRQIDKRNADLIDQANARLVENLLPILDACEAAMVHGAKDVGPIHLSLLGTLERNGLVKVHPADSAFDPELHDAVLHEPAEADDVDGPKVIEVLRTGYSLNGRVLRPAMVKVRG